MNNLKIKEVVSKIRKCSKINHIEQLMNGMVFRHCANKYEDNYISVYGTNKQEDKNYIKLKNPVYTMLYKLVIFLVYEGYGAEERQGKGRILFANQLHTVLCNIEKIKPNINSLDELKRTDLEDLLEKNEIGTKKIGVISTNYQYEKLSKLVEIEFRLNYYLPSFLKVYCIDYFESLPKYQELKVKSNYRNNGLMFGDKKYDLDNIKKITKYSLDYIKKYKHDVFIALELLELYDKTNKTNKTKYQKRKILFDEIKNHKEKFFSPELVNLKRNIDQYNNFHQYIKNNQSTGFYLKIKKTINLFEASALIILLITTGARKGELVLLKRHPKYKRVGTDTIEKTIIKTSYFENGHEVDLPIVDVTKKAISILSQLGEFYDNSKVGDLLRFYKISKNNLYVTLHRRIEIVTNECEFEAGSVTPHMFRHAIAYLMYSSSKNKRGIDLVKILLAHNDYKMTLQYLGKLNNRFNEIKNEYIMRESYQCIDEVSQKIGEGELVYGPSGERIRESKKQFIGEIKDNYHEFFNGTYKLAVNQGKVVVMKTEFNYCIRTLDTLERAACQMGVEFIGDIALPEPISCEGGNCPSALIFSSQLDEINKYKLDDETLNRLLSDKSIDRDKLIEFDAYRKYKRMYKEEKENTA